MSVPANAQCVPAVAGQPPSLASLERSFSESPSFGTAISAADQILTSGGSSADARLWSERARTTSKPGCERASALLRMARAARLSGNDTEYRRLLRQSHDEFPLAETEQALLAAPRPAIVAADDISRALSVGPTSRTRDLVVAPEPDNSPSIDLAINFDSDSARLSQQGLAQLRELATALRTLGAPRVLVVGHTDLRGSAEYNLALSVRRAQAVQDALVERYGFPAEDIEIEGRGLEEPIVNGHTAAHDALNRRVEVQTLP